MNRILFSAFILCVMSLQTSADNSINISQAWIKEAPPRVSVLAAYMKIDNPTSSDQTLIAISSPAFERIEFHQTVIKDGIARMQQAKQLIIPANSDLTLSPNGYHLMLIGKKKPIKQGDRIYLEFMLASDEKQGISIEVKKAESASHDHHHHHPH